MTPHAIRAFVINLDRSADRLRSVTASAAKQGLEIVRVPGIEGKQLDLDTHAGVDISAFQRVNGRTIIAGEVGCYLSHIKALEAFLAQDDRIGLICEDDVEFTADTQSFLQAISVQDGWDVVKLISFRRRGFVACRKVAGGWVLGRCIHGPSGSSAAYAVTREGARRLIQVLNPMIVPFDVALERGWRGNIRFFMLNRSAIALQPEPPSTITQGGGYGRVKYPFYRRTGTLAFRASEYLHRLRFALAGKALGGPRR